MIPKLESLSMEEVVANSFRDYHVRGFDYLCLKRHPKETVKVYFFDGDVSKLPEIVHPHDHRYDFRTAVLCGRSQNVWYEEASEASIKAGASKRFEKFAFDTPLVGGIGFTHVGQADLIESARASYQAGQWYAMGHREVHTIRMLENETVLALVQYEDRVTDRPTATFTRHREPPSLEGMYKRFTPDGIRDKLRVLAERVPTLRLPEIA